jgi:hypothetical protein
LPFPAAAFSSIPSFMTDFFRMLIASSLPLPPAAADEAPDTAATPPTGADMLREQAAQGTEKSKEEAQNAERSDTGAHGVDNHQQTMSVGLLWRVVLSVCWLLLLLVGGMEGRGRDK